MVILEQNKVISQLIIASAHTGISSKITFEFNINQLLNQSKLPNNNHNTSFTRPNYVGSKTLEEPFSFHLSTHCT